MKRWFENTQERLKRPSVGATAIFKSLETQATGSVWAIRLFFSKASWLLAGLLALLAWLPPSSVASIDVAALQMLFGLYVLYVVFLELASRFLTPYYDSTAFQIFKIVANLMTVSALVWTMVDTPLAVWFFYSLPILQAIVYLSGTGALAVTLLAGASYWVCSILPAAENDYLSLMLNGLLLFILAYVLYWLFRAARKSRKLEHFEVLLDIQKIPLVTNSTTEFYDTLEEIITAVVKTIQADRGSLILVDRDNQPDILLQYPGTTGSNASPPALPPEQSIIERVVRTQEPYLSYDLCEDALPLQSQSAQKINSCLIVPLVSHGRSLGVFSVHSSSINVFDENDIQLLLAFASYLGDRIEKTKLLDALQALGQSSSLNLHEALRIILRELETVIRYDSGAVFLVDKEVARVVATRGFPESASARAISIALAEDALFQEMSHTSRPLIIDNVRNDKRFRGLGGTGYVRGWLGVPLVIEGNVIGCLTLDSRRAGEFNQTDAELATIFARHAALAIENARLFEHKRRRTEELETLRKTALDITACLEEDELLQTILRRAVELLQARGGGVYRYNPERRELTLVADHSCSASTGQQTLAAGEGLAGRLIESQDSYLIVNNYPAGNGTPPDYPDQELGTVLEVPLIWQEQRIGILHVDGTSEREFSPEDAHLLSLFASQATIALKNAQLFEEAARERDLAKRREARLRALNQVALEITSNRQVPALTRSILERAVDLLQAKGARLYALDAQSMHFQLVAASRELEHFVGLKLDIDTSIIGRAIKAKSPFSVPNYRRWEHRVRRYDPYNFRAVVGVPITWQGKIWGGISIHDDIEGRAFDNEDLTVLSNFGNLAAIALETAELVTQLREQKDHWKRLISSLPIGVIALDRSGHLTDINDQAQHILGYGHSEICNQSVELLYGDAAEMRKVGAAMDVAPNNKLTNYETNFRGKEGNLVPVRLAATWLYDVQKNRVGSVGYFEDLRSIKEAENRLNLLLKANNTVAHAQSLDEGLQSLAEILVTYLDVTFCRCFLLDERQQNLVAKGVFPVSNHTPSLGWEPGPQKNIAIARWPGLAEVLATGQPKLMRIDEPAHRDFLIERSKLLKLEHPARSLLLIPLKTGVDVVGLLALAELRSWQQAPFSPQKRDLAISIADQTGILIDRMRLYEVSERRQQLLDALDEASLHIKGEKETFKLLQEVVRLAATLVDCSMGGLFINYPNQGQLILKATYQLPDALFEQPLFHTEGIIGEVARTGHTRIEYDYDRWPDREHIFEDLSLMTLIATPIKSAGKVEAVLFVADNSRLDVVGQAGLEVLEKFAAQAAIALQTSRLMDREQRVFKQLDILHRIGDYIQATHDLGKILHVIITGVTAGYGLRYNRAAIFLVNERQKCLSGKFGIGFLERQIAQEDWKTHREQGLEDFSRYLETLAQTGLPLTPVGQRITKLAWSLDDLELGVFREVTQDRCHQLVQPEQFDRLPQSFRKAFQPATPVIIAPLVAHEQIIGLLVADNKFTCASITKEDIEILLTLADTAAAAINNLRLYRETEVAKTRLTSLFEASNEIAMSKDPQQLLQKIVERARVAVKAAWVSIALIDEATGHAQNLAIVGRKKEAGRAVDIRPNGLSMQVMETGKYKAIENVEHHKHEVNPFMVERNIAAAICLPFSLQGKRIGVMWTHYNQPRDFLDEEIYALELYANQAAIAYDTSQRMKNLENMRQTAEALAGAMNSKDILAQVVHMACEVMESDSASVFIFNARQERFTRHGSVTAGVPKGIFKRYCQAEAWQIESDWILQNGWVGVEDVCDIQQHEFLEDPVRRVLSQMGIKGFQGIGLVENDEITGVLYVNYKKSRIFSDEARRMMQTFSELAVMALKRARLSDQVGKANEAARMVAEVSVLEDLSSTLASIETEIRRILGCNLIIIWPYDLQRKQFVSSDSVETNAGQRYLSEAERSSVERLLQYILHSNDLFFAEDNTVDSLLRDSSASWLEQQSLVGIPLSMRNRQVGAMLVGHHSSHRFAEDELDNIKLFAHQAAIAIGHAQLYRQVQQRVKAFEALSEAGQVVTGSLDLNETLDRIVEKVRRLTEYQGIEISFACIRLIEGTKSRVVAAFPKAKLDQSNKECWGDAIDLSQETDHHIGIMGRAAREGKPQLVGNVFEDPDYLPCNPETKSELAVPITIDNQVIGVLNAEHSEFNAFTKIDRQTLQSLAGQAGIAIKNARLYQDRERHAELLESAAQVARQATKFLDINRLLEQIVDRIVDRFAYFYHAAVFLIDEQGEYAVLKFASSEAGKSLIKQNFKLQIGHEGIVGRVALTGEPYWTLDIKKDRYYYPNPYLAETQTEVTFPLIAREGVIGVLDAQSKEKIRLKSEDIAALQTMADQLANALNNAKLYEAEQARLRQLEVIHEVSSTINATTNLNEISAVALREMVRIFDLTTACVMLLDLQENQAQIVAHYPANSDHNMKFIALQEIPIAVELIHHKRPMLIEHDRLEYGSNDFQLLVPDNQVESLLLLPLLITNDVIGLVSLGAAPTRQMFTGVEQRLAQTMVSQLATAVKNLQSQKEVTAVQTANAAFALLSRWAHKVNKKSFALKGDLESLREDLPVGLYDEILNRMSETIGEVSLPIKTLLEGPEESLDKPVDLGCLLKEVATRLCDEKSVPVKPEFQIDPPTCHVRGNQLLLEIAIEMLIENAVQSIVKKGSAGKIGIRCWTSHRVVKTQIQDTGVGIPANILKDLFQRPVSSKRLGYGSFTAANILKLHKGKIRLVQTDEEGTTMEFYLPLAK